jgi:hypothetical protein
MGRNCTRKIEKLIYRGHSKFVLFTNYYWGNEFKQDKMAGTYGMYGEEKYSIFVEKILSEQTNNKW